MGVGGGGRGRRVDASSSLTTPHPLPPTACPPQNEHKEVKVDDILGAAEAKRIVRESLNLYQETYVPKKCAHPPAGVGGWGRVGRGVAGRAARVVEGGRLAAGLAAGGGGVLRGVGRRDAGPVLGATRPPDCVRVLS